MDTRELFKKLAESTTIGAGEKSRESVEDKLGRVAETGHEATAIADENFPGQPWDFSQKNAFRHALGTGLLAHELGGGLSGAALAKLVGYLWEARGLPAEGMSFDDRIEDTKYDLNANAIGAAESVANPDRAALIEALLKQAKAARAESPVGITESTPGYLSYKKQ